MHEAPVQYVKHFIKRENCCHHFRVIALPVPAVVANGDSSWQPRQVQWRTCLLSYFFLNSCHWRWPLWSIVRFKYDLKSHAWSLSLRKCRGFFPKTFCNNCTIIMSSSDTELPEGCSLWLQTFSEHQASSSSDPWKQSVRVLPRQVAWPGP